MQQIRTNTVAAVAAAICIAGALPVAAHAQTAGQVDLRYLEKPYYVVPRDAIGQEAFAVIRDAMSREKVDGLGRVVLSSRERPMLVAVMGNGLCGVTPRFAH